MKKSDFKEKLSEYKKAWILLDYIAQLDNGFPDLYTTFNQSSQYIESSTVVKPVSLMKNIAMSTSSLLIKLQDFDHKNPCGINTLINRAYFVVGKRLYLYDYAESRNIKILKAQDDIVAVGFVVPKPGLFNNFVKCLIVISSKRYIKIVSVEQHSNELLYVDSMAEHSIVTMLQIVGTSQGRIFALGDNEGIWELNIRDKETWFGGKLLLKQRMQGNILGFLFSGLGNSIIQMVSNEDGSVLYLLTEYSSIHVIYLGANGDLFEKICIKSDCIADARRLDLRSQHFTSSQRIVSIHPVSASESLYYHLVAITSNGCRIYYSTQVGVHRVGSDHNVAPDGLFTIHAKIPSALLRPNDSIDMAICRNAFTILVKNDSDNKEAEVVTFSPNVSNLDPFRILNQETSIHEISSSVKIEGKILDVAEEPLAFNDRRTSKPSYHVAPRRFFVFTTNGITILTKLNSSDLLLNLLTVPSPGVFSPLDSFSSPVFPTPTKVTTFLRQFGIYNGTALCIALVASYKIATPGVKSLGEGVMGGAAYMLIRIYLAGKSPASRLYSCDFYDGVALYIHRAFRSLLAKQLLVKAEDLSYSSNVTLEELDDKLLSLERVERLILCMREEIPEVSVTISQNRLLKLIVYLKEAFIFFKFILTNNLEHLNHLSPGSHKLLLESDIKQLLLEPEGISSLTKDLGTYAKNLCIDVDGIMDFLDDQCSLLS